MRESVILACISAVCAAPAQFTHPGVVVGADEVAAARARLASGSEPTTSFAATAAKLPGGQASYVPHGPPANGTISCGYYDHPDIGCSAQQNDLDSAYTQALLFALGVGDVSLAAAARHTIGLYSAGLKRYDNGSAGGGNEALQAAWAGAKFARTAELLRHTPGSGWTQADSDMLNNMMYAVTLPLLIHGTPANGNWEASFIEAMIGLAVFSENRTLYDLSVSFWKGRMPSYFYITADGSIPPPNPQPNCSPQPYCEWYNQTVFDARTTGVCQETCRDMGHMQMGMAAFVNGAATATLQGDDLLAAEAPRLFAASEFAASLLNGARSTNDTLLCSGRPGGVIAAIAPTFEIAHALFARTGMDDVQTRAQLSKVVRPHYAAGGQMWICGSWETLSHGLPLP